MVAVASDMEASLQRQVERYAMYESNLRVVKYDPLTFQCAHCDQQFAACDSLESLGADVTSHISKSHPHLLHSGPQHRAA